MIICLLLGAGKHADPKKIFLQTYMYHIKENSSLCLTSQQTYITSLSFSRRHKAMALFRRDVDTYFWMLPAAIKVIKG